MEFAERQYKKAEKKPAAFGWDVFNSATLYRAYEKRTENIPYTKEVRPGRPLPLAVALAFALSIGLEAFNHLCCRQAFSPTYASGAEAGCVGRR